MNVSLIYNYGLGSFSCEDFANLNKMSYHGLYFHNDDLITISMFIESKSQDLDIPLANDQ
jgi:hypothetical protein